LVLPAYCPVKVVGNFYLFQGLPLFALALPVRLLQFMKFLIKLHS